MVKVTWGYITLHHCGVPTEVVSRGVVCVCRIKGEVIDGDWGSTGTKVQRSAIQHL